MYIVTFTYNFEFSKIMRTILKKMKNSKIRKNKL